MSKIVDTGMLLPGAPKLRAKSMIESGSLEGLWGNLADSLGLSEVQLTHIEYEHGDSASHLLEEWKEGLSKSKLWPAPDYSALLEAGTPWQVVKTLKDIRDCFPAYAIRPYPAHLSAYVHSIQAGKQLADHMLSHWAPYEGVGSGAPSMHKIALAASLMLRHDYPNLRSDKDEYPPEWLEITATADEHTELQKFLLVPARYPELSKAALSALQNYVRTEGAKGMVSEAFRKYTRAHDKCSSLNRVLDERPYYRAHLEVTLMGLNKAPRNNDLSPAGIENYYRIFRRLKVKPRTVLPSAVKAAEEPSGPAEEKRPRRPVRLSTDEAKEAMANITQSASQSLERLVELGIARGVQIGEWVTQKERPALVASITQAFERLADANELPPYLLGLGRPLTSEQQQESRENGMIGDAYRPGSALGMALGARGRSKAAAHYEPGLHVINLTRFNGAGSLAHEWGHALDATLTHELVSLSKINQSYHPKDISRITGVGNKRIAAVSEWMSVFWHIRTIKASRGELRDSYDRELKQEIDRFIKPESNTPEARELLFKVGKLFENIYCKKRSLNEIMATINHQCASNIIDTASKYDKLFRDEVTHLGMTYSPKGFDIDKDLVTANGLYRVFSAVQKSTISMFEEKNDRDLTAESRANFENALLNAYLSGAFSIAIVEAAKDHCQEAHPELDFDSDEPAENDAAADLLRASVAEVLNELSSEQVSRLSNYVRSAHRGLEDIESECMKGFSMSDMQRRSGSKPLTLRTTDPTVIPIRRRCRMLGMSTAEMNDLEKGAFLREGLKIGKSKNATGFHPCLLESLEDTSSAFTTAILEQLKSKSDAVLQRFNKSLATLHPDDHPLIQSLGARDIDTLSGGVFAQQYLERVSGPSKVSELLSFASDPAWPQGDDLYSMLDAAITNRTPGMGEPSFQAAVLRQIHKVSKWDAQERVNALTKSKGKRLFPLTSMRNLMIGNTTDEIDSKSCIHQLEALAASDSSSFRYLTHQERASLISATLPALQGSEHLFSESAMHHYFVTGTLLGYDDRVPETVRSIAESIITANQDLNLENNLAYYRYANLRNNVNFKTTPSRVISEMVLNSAAFESAEVSPGGEAVAKGRTYWSTSKEVFARVFETCVYDTLHQKGMSDPYLVTLPSREAQAAIPSSVGVSPTLLRSWQRENVHYTHCYPYGAERELMTSSFQKLTPDLAPLLQQRFPEAIAMHELQQEKHRYVAMHDDDSTVDLQQMGLLHAAGAHQSHAWMSAGQEPHTKHDQIDLTDSFTAPSM